MGLFLKQDTARSELQSKIAADLKERLKQREPLDAEPEPAILDDQHTTRPAGVVIAVLLLVLVGVFIVWLLRLGGIF